jgi:GH15 family glucan-1,4-alpha-glucosidase
MATVGRFAVTQGESIAFVLTHSESHLPRPLPIDAHAALDKTDQWWREWSARSGYRGRWRHDVQRSLLTLKSLTFAPTGGIVAAPTTSLPEQPGGERNWDYRMCWLRDATFTLYALLLAGYRDEARAWREWLLRAAAGSPRDLQTVYSIRGERQVPEWQVPWLPGHHGARPVRVGNAAATQFQLDIYGEVMDALHLGRSAGLEIDRETWRFQKVLMEFLESNWARPDNGIWEVRGPQRQFTHSKVMAWVAADRAAKAIEQSGLDGPTDRWRALREAIRDDVCTHGYAAGQGTFVWYYGAREPDASLLLLPLVGFLPARDPRVLGTVAAIERLLLRDGLVHRYRSEPAVDGLPAGEGQFLPCSFWYADNLALAGRHADAVAVFERLLALRNDVGLLAEEYDPVHRLMLGNFPQALSHLALVNTARNLSFPGGPSEHRSGAAGHSPPAP